jgi:WD40 repeat protein
MRTLYRVFFGLVLVVMLSEPLSMAHIRPVSAQSSPASAVVSVKNQAETYTAIYSTGETTLYKIADLASSKFPKQVSKDDLLSAQLTFSRDGKWVIGQNQDFNPAVVYGALGGTLTGIDFTRPDGSVYFISGVAFSADNRYLAFTVSYDIFWILGIVDLSTGRRAIFRRSSTALGNGLDINAPFGNMAGKVIDWSPDNHYLYLSTYVVWGCDGPENLFALDVTGINFADPANVKLPAVTHLAKNAKNVLSYTFSADKTKVFYTYHDTSCGGQPDNANSAPIVGAVLDIANWQPQVIANATQGRFSPDGRLLAYQYLDSGTGTVSFGMFDVVTGQARPLVSTGGKRIPRDFRWTQDGGKLLVRGTQGNNAPHYLSLIDVASGHLDRDITFTGYSPEMTIVHATDNYMLYLEGYIFKGISFAGEKATPVELASSARPITTLICQDSLFYTIYQSDNTTLYGRPLADLKAPGTILAIAPVIKLIACDTSGQPKPPGMTATPGMTPTLAPIPPLTRVLQLASPQMKGDDVRLLQQRLFDLAYRELEIVDGVFGPKTDKAVRRFQTVNGLVVDGVVGRITWERLFSDKALASP